MITVDTHIIIWDALKPELLSEKAKNELERANQIDGIIFCDISLWEIAMLIKKKRIEIDVPYLEFIDLVKASNNYIFQEITPEIAELSANLPLEINSDPADRLISATSLISNTKLITADKNLRKSKELRTIW
ncbi:MAG: type II toxin-antitoxin system VapC family toxin [Candidatus Marinimicrobia bacterium]|nr:type II toxin-antitoxin system VapC family toxin [Candidatus Neomarinimicrobiota bacterium]